MKKLFVIFSLMSSISGNAQRIHDVYYDDLYKLIQSEIKLWDWKGYDIVNDSKCNIQVIKKLSTGKFAIEPVSKKTFTDMNTHIIQVPMSQREIFGHAQVWKQLEVLKHHANARAQLWQVGGRIAHR